MMNSTVQGRRPPLWMLVNLAVFFYAAAAVGLVRLFDLPWLAPLPLPVGLGVGVILWVAGGDLLVGAFRSLGWRRALGGELSLPGTRSRLITDGPYAYTRNPLYLAFMLLLSGSFFVSRLTMLAFLAILFAIHFLAVAKWEEKELGERFGPEYEEYRKRVPLWIPRWKRGKGARGEERHGSSD